MSTEKEFDQGENVSDLSKAPLKTNRRKLIQRMAMGAAALGVSGVFASQTAGATGLNVPHLTGTSVPEMEIQGTATSGGRLMQDPPTTSGINTPAATGDTFHAGEQIRTSDGALWICTAGDGTTVGTWGKVVTIPSQNGTAVAAAGALSFLATPDRYVDTISPAFGHPTAVTGPLAAGSTTTFTVAGVTGMNNTVAQGIPVGAIAVLGTVTAAGAAGTGSIKVYSAALASPPTSATVNFPAGAAITNSFTSAIDATGNLKVTIGGSATHVIIDILGYYI